MNKTFSQLMPFALFVAFEARGSVMNLNNDMPTHLEDASPIDAYAIDLQYSLVFDKRQSDQIRQRPNVRYGLSEDIQLETQATILSGGDEKYSGETDLGLLYRFNHSDYLIPEISLSGEAILPTGKEMTQVSYSGQVNATSTIHGTSKNPVTQIHFNYRMESKEDLTRTSYAFGFSHLILKQTALIVDAAIDDSDTYLFEAGLHHHMGKSYYIAISYGQGIGASDVKSQQLIGLEKEF